MRDGSRQIADRIVIGDVLVLDGRSTRAEAFAVADAKVLMVGRRGEVKRTGGSATEVDVLSGSTIIPGFNDWNAAAR